MIVELSEAMRRLAALRAAEWRPASVSTVLLQGESGVGKDVVAKYLARAAAGARRSRSSR
jgi:transcriptional regulator with GAF, ATPase, and Fis domain